MKYRLFLMLGLILSGCSTLLENQLPFSPTSTIILTIEVTLSPLPATNTPPSSPTVTETSTITPSETPSEIPTETPIFWTYFFPVQPSTAIDFAEGVASHGYPATDIFAQEGAKFVAVTNGIVDFVSSKDIWDPEHDDPALRGGLSVTIIGDDGVRYYGSHLSTIEPGINPGVRVIAGQLLGYVGHTGDVRTTPSHLHFGISHPTFPEDWHSRRGEVDPFPFLVA